MDSGIASKSSPVSRLFFARALILARLGQLLVASLLAIECRASPYLFWNQIWTERSVMLISSAIRSRTLAVGVGFLLNSISNVVS